LKRMRGGSPAEFLPSFDFLGDVARWIRITGKTRYQIVPCASQVMVYFSMPLEGKRGVF
jgi:hypothetical protein